MRSVPCTSTVLPSFTCSFSSAAGKLSPMQRITISSFSDSAEVGAAAAAAAAATAGSPSAGAVLSPDTSSTYCVTAMAPRKPCCTSAMRPSSTVLLPARTCTDIACASTAAGGAAFWSSSGIAAAFSASLADTLRLLPVFGSSQSPLPSSVPLPPSPLSADFGTYIADFRCVSYRACIWASVSSSPSCAVSTWSRRASSRRKDGTASSPEQWCRLSAQRGQVKRRCVADRARLGREASCSLVSTLLALSPLCLPPASAEARAGLSMSSPSCAACSCAVSSSCGMNGLTGSFSSSCSTALGESPNGFG
ncbi:hypothetical protein DQ04_18011000 [Trypanosoma grayi]|uniref:hypothetical protein n=1 Tax=Trypanosoma grayi TaxID=71804 RepID=UPI0004F45F2E|nr:hypothetical protein DQ04_18011000 [Trypanosoma grayi]KEG05839.1 hypothetical protein DQ04_18011000 [Trypanosoma grayi]